LRIIILADYKEKEGGTNEVIKHMIRALTGSNDSSNTQQEIFVEYINREKYLPKYLPRRWKDLFRIFYLNRISNDSYFRQFDIAITLQPDSHCIRHENHVVYFQHHIKQYYDLFSHSFRQRKGIRKKTVFLLLTALARISDKIYLTPNLKNAHLIASSQTVGQRLKKYNQISNCTIINPGCDITPQEVIIPQNQNVEKINVINGLVKLNNYQFILLAFSRLNIPQKGIDIILDTASFVPSYQFIIAGPYDITLETIDIRRIPKNVKFIVKNFTCDEKAYLFRKCDVFLAPYIKEDFGITPLEANSYGKPVLYCDDSGEVVHTQKHKTTGYMSRRNPQQIVKGIEYCIKNKESMKSACIDNASQHLWDKFEISFRRYVFQKTVNANSYNMCLSD
jgi:glycosyltransferase involved in cell wall biosynthesis